MRRFWQFPALVAVSGFAACCIWSGVVVSGQVAPPPPPPPQAPQTQSAAPPRPTGTGKVSGRVVALDNGAPAKRVLVSLTGGPALNVSGRASASGTPGASANGPAPQRGAGSGQSPTVIQKTQETDAAGRFEFKGLPAGRFTLNAMSQDNYTRTPSETVQLAEGGSSTVTFRLERTGAIAGRVYDEVGDPLPRAMVRATRWESTGGIRRLIPVGSGSNGTDDRGEFRLWALPPGEYFVSASYNPGNYGPTTLERDEPKYGLAPTYYPGVASMDLAQRVIVRSGQDMPGVDIMLQRAKMGRITATAVDSAGMPLSQRGYLSLSSRSDSIPGGSGMSRRQDGTYVSGDLPPGDYYLAANHSVGQGPDNPTEGAIVPVSVNGDDVEVHVQLNKGATVSGKVVVEGKMPEGTVSYSTGPQQTVQARIMVRATQATNSMIGYIQGTSSGRPGPMQDDGTFQLTGLRGSFRLAAQGNRTVLKAARQGGRDILATPLQLDGTEEITDVELVVTTETGSIDGAITNAKGEPAAGAYVIIFTDDATKWFEGSPYVRQARAATVVSAAGGTPGGSGSSQPMPGFASGGGSTASAASRAPGGFLANTLLPGRYGLIAIESVTSATGPAYDPEALEKLKSSATYVTVAAGETATVQMKTVKQ